MLKALPALLALLMALAPPAAAQERSTLGIGRLFVNDATGDGRDRWRTGAYMLSIVRGRDWQGRAPARVGEIMEYRFRAEIVAPANLADPAPGDRRHAGILSVGAHTHADFGGWETRLGFDLVATGPATGLGDFQTSIHRILDLPLPDLSNQIGNGLHPMLSAEIGREFVLGAARVRPFVEAQAGFETLARVGVDLSFGSFGQGALLLRDTTTGQRTAGIRGQEVSGFGVVLGADVARVWDSVLLPAGGPAAEDRRDRLRLGLQWRGQRAEVFWGVTRLSPEFEGQPSGQTVGTIRARIRF